MGLIADLYSKYEDFVTNVENKLGNNISSIIYIFIAISTNFTMLAWSKVHVNQLPPVQGQAFRGILITILIYIYSAHKRIPLYCENISQDRLRILRNVIASSYNIVLFFIVIKVPMSTTFMIQTSSPFMIAAIDHVFHKTTYTKVEIIFSFVSMAGVLFIIKPELFVEIENIDLTQYGYSEGAERVFLTLFLVFAVICWSGSVVMLKALKNMNAMTMNFPFGICMTIASSLLQIEAKQVKNPSIWIYIQSIFILGIVTFINQHTYVKANQLGKPAKIAMLTNLNVVLSFLFEIFYLKEEAQWFSFVGATLIVGSSLILSISRLEVAKKEGK